jgi:hypothetical protein
MSTPKRTQYFFDLSGVKYKSKSDIMTMQRQWDTFERIENHDDVIYQQFEAGNRSNTYYQFRERAEATDYRNGQELHILRYPNLPASTFDSIRNRPMPNVAIKTPPSYYYNTPTRGVYFSTATTSSEQTSALADLSIYTHVSSYNATHVYKYAFVSNEEQLAYHRAERRIRFPNM